MVQLLQDLGLSVELLPGLGGALGWNSTIFRQNMRYGIPPQFVTQYLPLLVVRLEGLHRDGECPAEGAFFKVLFYFNFLN